jgi:predicted membrane channel-forming protein YqfA (hemolysin III family)
MSSAIPWVAIAVLVLLLLLLVVYVFKKEKREPDYRLFFRIGVIWLAIGLAYPLVSGRPFELSGLITLGLIFTIAGLANKSKWKEKPEPLTKN